MLSPKGSISFYLISMKTLFYSLILLLFACVHLKAQDLEKPTFLQRAAKLFSETDSNYIAPNKYNFTFMIEQSFWHERYRLRTRHTPQKQSIGFAPSPTPKIGLYFGWRWIFLGISFNIPGLTEKRKEGKEKKEFVLNLYSARIGLDLYYRKTGNNFHITSYSNFNLPDTYDGKDFEGLHSKIAGFNAYWIFNSKRFSYPAAYSQSTNQKRSCGSLMAGMSYSNHDIFFDYTKLPPEMIQHIRPSLKFNRLRYNDFNISFGYGYNWVFAKNCLLNLSLMPAIAYKKAKADGIELSEQDDNHWLYWTKDLNFDLITRAGVVWNNSKYYVGASLVINTYDYRKNRFAMTNSFGSLRIYAGFNFWKRQEFRQKQ